MKGFLNSLKFKIFVVIALVLIGLMIRTTVMGGMGTFTADAVSFIVSPVQKISASVSGFFSGIVNDIASFGTVSSENEQLKKQISDLQSKIVNYDAMLRENQQLRQGMDLLKENPDFKLKPAIVISHDPEQWFSSITIDKGSADGIKYQDAVITPGNDLVGKVMKLYPHTAEVATILDPSVQAGILISETGDPGKSQGDLSLLSEGEFEAGFLPRDSAVSPGDIVVTSGISGIFPKNLKLGMVDSVGADDTGIPFAICRPMISPASLKSVYVLTDFNGKSAVSDPQSGGS